MKFSTLFVSLVLALGSVDAHKKHNNGHHKGHRKGGHHHKANLTREFAAEVARTIVNHGDVLHVSTLREDGYPVTMPEYYVSSDYCKGVESTGNPILVLMNVSSTLQHFKDNGKLTMTVEGRKHHAPVMESPRANLFGTLKEVETSDALKACFAKRHPDSASWLPGTDGLVHDAAFYEFDVEKLYYVGGFGNVAYIGDIDGELYHSSQPLKHGKHHHKGGKAKDESEKEVVEKPKESLAEKLKAWVFASAGETDRYVEQHPFSNEVKNDDETKSEKSVVGKKHKKNKNKGCHGKKKSEAAGAADEASSGSGSGPSSSWESAKALLLDVVNKY